MVNDLHPTLKEELFFYQYGDLIKKLDFIQNISHSECKWAIVRSLKKIMFGKGDLIYNDDYISESIYFIEIGQVRLYADNGFPF
jgi:CRP-like cAMP-binding protein